MSHRLALLIVGVAARLLPAPLRGWGRAMETEAGAIGREIGRAHV